MNNPLISVVIPTLNEEDNLDRLLAEIRRDGSAPVEIIVSDGGSDDRTIPCARRQNVSVVTGVSGRGSQLAAGVAAAKGDVIWFLHADSVVSPGSLAAIRQEIDVKGRNGGNFALVFDGQDRFSTWLTGFYAWFRRHGLYYGDSGIFLQRDVYDRIGGIKSIALMEDYDLSRRMERWGNTGYITTPPLVTSSRKFRGRHPASIFAGWVKLHILYWLGVAPASLERMYYRR